MDRLPDRIAERIASRGSARRAQAFPANPFIEPFTGPTLSQGLPESGLWYDVSPPPAIAGSWLSQFVSQIANGYAARRRFGDTDELTIKYRLRHTAGTPKGYHYLYFISDQDQDHVAPGIGGANNITYIDIGASGQIQVYGRNLGNWGFPADTFGADVSLNDGAYHDITVYMRLNDVGSANGILQCWVDGNQDLNLSNITYRTSSWLWRHVLLGIELNLGADTMDVEVDQLECYPSDQRPSPGVTYFSWDCESWTTNLGTGTPSGGAFLTTFDPHSGSSCMELPIPGDSQPQVGLSSATQWTIPDFYDGDWIYYRWWMKFSDDFSWGSGDPGPWSKASRIKDAAEAVASPVTGILRPGGVWIHECPGCVPTDTTQNTLVSYDFNPQTNPILKSWTEVIVGFKKQSGIGVQDGMLRLWVNGVYQGTTSPPSLHEWSSQTINFAEAWGAWMVWPLPQLNGLPTDGGTIWVDDFLVSNVWNSSQFPYPGP